MTTPTTIRLYGTAPDSIVDGPGLRYAVFVQGCSHACPGCHNPNSQPCAGGTVRTIEDVAADIAANKLAQGVTISGGEPFEQAAACAELARRCQAIGLSVWTYSGYVYEQLAARSSQSEPGAPDASHAPQSAADIAAMLLMLILPAPPACWMPPTCLWTAPSCRRATRSTLHGAVRPTSV